MLFIRRKMLGKEFKKAHSATFLGFTLITIGFYFLINSKANLEDLINWPVAYFLTLWLLCMFIPSFFLKGLTLGFQKKVSYQIGIGLLFGIVHMTLSDVVIILLERLMKLPEHYALTDLPVKWLASWHDLFHGFLWYLVYLGFLNIVYFRESYLAERALSQRLRASLSNAQVKTLSAELNPHFLFNAMNSIATQIRKNENTQAIEGLAGLGDMLRAVLNTRNEVFIPLKGELDLLNHYISLEKRRFGDKVVVEVECEPEILDILVPKLILQPIVENAFKHGVTLDLNEVRILVRGLDMADAINLQVFNSCKRKMNWTVNGNKSIGLPNTVERLRKLYGTDYSFHVKQSETGVLVDIKLPKK